MDIEYYRQPGPLTALRPDQVALARALGLGPAGLCRVARDLFWAPEAADGSTLSPARWAERNTRPAADLLARALELEGTLSAPRSPDKRVCGTCRHVAVMATALLRATGVAARARCGFATYFQAGKKLDHWVTEYRGTSSAPWVRVDPELLGTDVGFDPEDLGPGLFLTGGEAWALVRDGAEDAGNFGVVGTNNWGPAEIRGNLLRDLAALVKIEMLPWDEWGPMASSYKGLTGEDFDRAMDDVAHACHNGDVATVQRAYAPYAVPVSQP